MKHEDAKLYLGELKINLVNLTVGIPHYSELLFSENKDQILKALKQFEAITSFSLSLDSHIFPEHISRFLDIYQQLIITEQNPEEIDYENPQLLFTLEDIEQQQESIEYCAKIFKNLLTSHPEINELLIDTNLPILAIDHLPNVYSKDVLYAIYDQKPQIIKDLASAEGVLERLNELTRRFRTNYNQLFNIIDVFALFFHEDVIPDEILIPLIRKLINLTNNAVLEISQISKIWNFFEAAQTSHAALTMACADVPKNIIYNILLSDSIIIPQMINVSRIICHFGGANSFNINDNNIFYYIYAWNSHREHHELYFGYYLPVIIEALRNCENLELFLESKLAKKLIYWIAESKSELEIDGAFAFFETIIQNKDIHQYLLNFDITEIFEGALIGKSENAIKGCLSLINFSLEPGIADHLDSPLIFSIKNFIEENMDMLESLSDISSTRSKELSEYTEEFVTQLKQRISWKEF